MCAVMALANSVYANGTDEIFTENCKQAILEQAVSLSDDIGDISKYEIISTSSNNISTHSRSASTEYVLQKEETIDDQVCVTTILPYKTNEDGKLENSFAFAARVGSEYYSGKPVDVNFTDVTVTYQAYYNSYASQSTSILIVHQPLSVAAKWNSSSNVTVSNLHAQYASAGMEVYYPECTQAGYTLDDVLVYGDTEISTYWYIDVIASSPQKNYRYIQQKAFPSNRALIVYTGAPDSYFMNGTVQVEYVSGGTRYIETADVDIYGGIY